jgi:iron complex outermembrane receptor protein
VLPAFAQQEAAGEQPPPDAVGETDEAREDDAEPETDPDGDETAGTDAEPVDEPETPVALQDDDIEEIVVKGSSRATKLDEPISIMQFGVEQMRAEGIRDIRDLSNFTPSLEIKSAFAATNATIFIRGVGLDDFNANAVSAVAIYQDGVYLNSPSGQLFGFFDLENVEVLRGPQGTLYRNASAGAILIHSRAPTDEFEAYVSTTYGRFNQVDVEGAVGGPIIPDLLSGRVSGSWSIRDPLTKNRCAGLSRDELDALGQSRKGEPPEEGFPLGSWCGQFGNEVNDDGTFGDKLFVVDDGMGSHTNDIDGWGARGQLLFTVPPEWADMEWLLNFHGGQNRSRAAQYQHRGVKFDKTANLAAEVAPPLGIGFQDFQSYIDTDGDIFAGDYDNDGPENLDLFGTSATGTWRFGDGYELESITAFEWNERFSHENSDGSPVFVLESDYINTSWQVSQELNLRGEWAQADFGDGTWALGAFYMQEDLEVDNYFDQAGAGFDLLQTYDQKLRTAAAYAYTDYKIQPGCEPIPCDFTLIAGVRYNVVYKEFDINGCFGIRPRISCRSDLLGTEDDTWNDWSGEISLAWHFYQDNSIYLKWARGWKGGHYNGGASGRNDIITSVDPEIVDSFEGGLRSNWFDGRLMFNATGFYYDYQDLQVFQLVQSPLGFPISRLVNAEDAVVYGVEIDMAAEPLPGLNITFNGAWVDSEYLDFTVLLPFRKVFDPGANKPKQVVNFDEEFDYSGNVLIASPNFSMTGSISYEIPLPGSIGTRGLGFLTPRFSYSWKDDINFDAAGGRGAFVSFPEETFGQESFWIYNASLAWRSENGGLEVIGWVHNFLDEHYKSQSFDVTRAWGTILDAYADPRTYGLTVTLTY